MPYKDALKDKECKRQWYLDNRDRVLKEAKISYQNNAVLKRKQSKEYREKNILRIRDRYEKKKLEDIEQVLTRRDKNKEEAILSKGGKCEICGFECYVDKFMNPDEIILTYDIVKMRDNKIDYLINNKNLFKEKRVKIIS